MIEKVAAALRHCLTKLLYLLLIIVYSIIREPKVTTKSDYENLAHTCIFILFTPLQFLN